MALLCPCEETLQEEAQKHVSMFQGGESVSLSAGSTISMIASTTRKLVE